MQIILVRVCVYAFTVVLVSPVVAGEVVAGAAVVGAGAAHCTLVSPSPKQKWFDDPCLV